MLNTRIHTGELVSPIQSLEDYFRKGGVSIIQAAFAHSYFVHPDEVRAKTPYYPNRARYSKEHYPGPGKGELAVWSADGREVKLDDNQSAQRAWARYTRRSIDRGRGYGLRHIWGNTHNPDAFTAGWNFCYMPFWAGMLTEDQHPHPELQKAIRQASWELYFADNPVCQPPDFVENPSMDLGAILNGQPLLTLSNTTQPKKTPAKPLAPVSPEAPREEIWQRVKEVRAEKHQSWSNICKAVRSLQNKEHEPFGTVNVGNSSKACVRKILRETGLTLAQLETLLVENGFC